jgi:acyl-CoA thioester hydrolase
MYTYRYEHRVRYRECDPMGVVYHTHYLDYFEAARTEALRDLGVRYRDLESDGIIMPVVSATVDYKRSARYDDVLVIEAQFPEMPQVRVPIDYVVRRAGDDDVLATGHTDLCFMDAERRRPVRIPDPVQEAFRPHLPENA